MEDLTGKQLGPYRVVAPLGEGGMAAVYKAYQPGVDRYVALKILARHYTDDPNFVARFRQEAQVIAVSSTPASFRFTTLARRMGIPTLPCPSSNMARLRTW